MSGIITPNECVVLSVNIDQANKQKWKNPRATIDNLTLVQSVPCLHRDYNAIGEGTLASLMCDLKTISSAIKYPRLLICGSYLEEQITVCTLAAIAEGFDVFLLNDLNSFRDKRFGRIHEIRLYQAGAVPTTLGQFIYQWMADEAGKIGEK